LTSALVDGAIRISTYKPSAVVVFQRPQCKADLTGQSPKDYDWTSLTEKVGREHRDVVPCEEMKSTDELYLLYTSGTTGKPKGSTFFAYLFNAGIVRESGGHAVQLAFTMQFLFDLSPNETIFCASDIGWVHSSFIHPNIQVVGHTFIVYAPLLNGSTTILYEGKPVGTPNAGIFWRIVNEYNVKALFTAPTALRAIKRDDSDGEYLLTGGYEKGTKGLRSLQAIFLAGERSEPTLVTFYQSLSPRASTSDD
jgi:propionyl-CoA synthetase